MWRVIGVAALIIRIALIQLEDFQNTLFYKHYGFKVVFVFFKRCSILLP